MSPSANPDDGGAGEALADEARLRSYAETLAAGIEATLGPWVERSVAAIAEAWRPGLATELADAARRAGGRALTEVGPKVRDLLAADVDRQRTSPLALLRGAVRYPTEVLAAAGVPEVVRDEFAERAFPTDVYGLAPAAFADVSPSLHEPGLAWGAAKAHVVLARRRAEGKR